MPECSSTRIGIMTISTVEEPKLCRMAQGLKSTTVLTICGGRYCADISKKCGRLDKTCTPDHFLGNSSHCCQNCICQSLQHCLQMAEGTPTSTATFARSGSNAEIDTSAPFASVKGKYSCFSCQWWSPQIIQSK